MVSFFLSRTWLTGLSLPGGGSGGGCVLPLLLGEPFIQDLAPPTLSGVINVCGMDEWVD